MLDKSMAADLASPRYYVIDTDTDWNESVAIFYNEKDADNYIDWLNGKT